MEIKGIHHVNIGCRASDLQAIEKFYCGALGLKVGHRPDFPSGGLWLYCGDHPLVHVVTRFPENWSGNDETRSGYDHAAYNVVGVEACRERLTGLGIRFEEQNVPNAGYQIFLRDPVGNKVELNFPNEKPSQSVAAGTLAAMQFPEHAGR
ncbi:MAG: VOC family protein [Pseudomonadota bacterium]